MAALKAVLRDGWRAESWDTKKVAWKGLKLEKKMVVEMAG